MGVDNDQDDDRDNDVQPSLRLISQVAPQAQ